MTAPKTLIKGICPHCDPSIKNMLYYSYYNCQNCEADMCVYHPETMLCHRCHKAKYGMMTYDQVLESLAEDAQKALDARLCKCCGQSANTGKNLVTACENCHQGGSRPPSPMAMVREFHEKFHVAMWPLKEYYMVPQSVGDLRARILDDEIQEIKDAAAANDIIEFADGLGDAAYILYGTAAVYGIDLDAVLAEIHRSNMTKLGPDGQPIFREDGKVLKGPNFEPPHIARVLGMEIGPVEAARAEQKEIIKGVLKHGCSCDAMVGYSCGIHDALLKAFPDTYMEAAREWHAGT